jgi:two-component system sensor histidine kinase/response regulator
MASDQKVTAMVKPIILLVEDDLALLNGMCDTLDLVGYRTVSATNGQEALTSLQQVRPDLIISDIMMPEMDGYDFHQAVSSNPETATIPFIFLTAKTDQADVRKGLRDGVDAYLIKPFELEDLLIHVENKLRRFATIRQDAVTQLEELQQQIITMFSHELRTPLTYIQGYTDLLAGQPEAFSRDEMATFLQGIQVGSSRLNRLVENLLALVQLDTGVFRHEYENFAALDDVGRLVRLASNHLAPTATNKGLTIDISVADNLPPVRLVSTHINQVVGNLLDNAIKFSHRPKSKVLVRVYQNADRLLVEVIDEGIGIGPHDAREIFQRFRQVNRAKHEQAGLGVGLAIARGLMHIHGGDIELVSKPGEGSKFTAWFPLSRPVGEPSG